MYNYELYNEIIRNQKKEINVITHFITPDVNSKYLMI